MSDQYDGSGMAKRILRLQQRLAEAERLLRPLAECDPDIREWLGMPRWGDAAQRAVDGAPDNGEARP